MGMKMKGKQKRRVGDERTRIDVEHAGFLLNPLLEYV